MADFSKGQTFLDLQSVNIDGTKGKYFISLSDANFDDDEIICFVMNTEHYMERYKVNCNKKFQRFIIVSGTFSFITKNTSIMLEKEWYYKYSEMYVEKIKILDLAPDILTRQIKNCIDWGYILPRARKIIEDCFKS